MNLHCIGCEAEFEADYFVGYCPDCNDAFRNADQRVAEASMPAGAIHVTGKFREPSKCPKTLIEPWSDRQVCGLCGCDELTPGYGFAGGYGLGAYLYCEGCNTVLEFFEDEG